MKLRYFFYGCLLLLSSPIWSQKLVEKGHKQFQELAYSDAIISLEKAVEKGFKNTKIYTELADSYYFNANYQASAKWYQLLLTKPENILPIHYFRYAQSLKSIGKDKEAKIILEQMSELISKQNQKDGSTTKVHNENYTKNSGRFNVELASFNSVGSDFGPTYYGNKIVFTSARDTGSVFKRNHSWTNQNFTDLYFVNPDSANSKPALFSKKINSIFNESTAVFTKNGLTMYFTRNNFYKGVKGINKNQTTLLKIYKAVKNEEDWNVIGALPFCNDNYNVAHPALSPDEKTLYFASDMPGGFGESDLYKVSIESDGTFGTPENLGKTINTFGRETFAFASENQEFYFASDGHQGFGGLDVFVSNLDENSNFSQPQNIGEPVNSRMDDFGFIMNFENKTGFFSSNRSNGVGMDDIYSFKELKTLPCETILRGNIASENPQTALSKIEIILLDANSNPITSTNPDEKGNYNFVIDCKNKYTIRTVLKGYVSQEIAVIPKLYISTTLENMSIEKEKAQFQVGDDLAEKLALLPIYFDLGKANIRHDAAIELEKIKEILLEYPNIKIDIRSHTDSRDSAENNQKLSDKRAKSTLEWFVDKGINSTRLSGKGYGEAELLNNCSDGVSCSEIEHQLNRRSEFIITGI